MEFESGSAREQGMALTAADDCTSDYLERARDFAPELAAAAPEIERQRELPEAVVAAMAERGFFRMLLPRSLGGAELLPAPYIRVVEEIAKADASAAWCLNQGAGCSMTAAYLDPAAAREVFGGPCGILAWGPGPGKAQRVKGGYRVTATWSFASGSHNATWLGCHVPIYDENSTQLFHPDGSPVVRTPLFPKILCRDDRHLACHRVARHRQREILGHRSVRAGGICGSARR
jgi:alkylation response protein AidB-like acyl-CoA dehydrogenase